MPIYSYICPDCGLSKDVYKPVEKYNEPETCVCSSKMRKVVNNIGIHVPSDRVRQAEKDAAANNAIIKEPGLDKDIKRNREYREAETRKRIRRVAEETVRDVMI